MGRIGALGVIRPTHAGSDDVYFSYMKGIYYLLIGGIVVIAIGVAVLILSPKTKPAPGSSYATSTNPFGQPAGSFPVSSATPNGSIGLNLRLNDGTVVSVPDFTRTNQPPTSNAESGYQVAGTNTEDYQILYYPKNSGILVSLFSEPLGPVRLVAENALRAALGLSDSQLCKLTVDVRTTADVSDTYSGRNLGLSFCPGATILPK